MLRINLFYPIPYKPVLIPCKPVLIMPIIKETKPQRISWEEGLKIMDGLKNRYDRPKMSAYVALALNTGLRISDLKVITWGMVFSEKKEIVLVEQKKSKAGKALRKPISQTLIDHVRMCWFECGQPPLDTEVLLSRRKENPQPMATASINEQLKNWHDWFNISIEKNRFSTHSLRKAAGFRVYQISGNSLEAARKFLGHESYDNTRLYLELDTEEERALVEKMM